MGTSLIRLTGETRYLWWCGRVPGVPGTTEAGVGTLLFCLAPLFRLTGPFRLTGETRYLWWGGGVPGVPGTTEGTGCPRHDGRYRVSPARRKRGWVPGVPGMTEGGGLPWVPGVPGTTNGQRGYLPYSSYRGNPVSTRVGGGPPGVPGVPGTTKEGGTTEGTGCPRYDESRCAHNATGAAVWPPLLGWLRYVRLVACAPPVVSWRSKTGLLPERQPG